MDDIVIGAKTRVLSETAWRPAAALRFATRLPNASNESGLGLDTFDFVNTLLVGKTIGSIHLVENVGLGILSDPTQGDRQNDMVMYGQSLAWALTQATEIVVEVNVTRIHGQVSRLPARTVGRPCERERAMREGRCVSTR